MSDLLTQGTTYSITELVGGNITRVAVHISDFCNKQLSAASVPATTNNSLLTVTLPQSITRTLPVGTASIRVSFNLPDGEVVAIYRNIYVLPADIDDSTVDPVDPGDGGGGGVITNFDVQYGFGSSRTDFSNLTTISTNDRGTEIDTGVAELGQFFILIFPAGNPPATLVNTGLGANVLEAYTLAERTDGQPWVYTLGALRAGADFTYRITY